MYHFVATCPPEPLDLSERVQIPGHIRQYLKNFQIEALRFLHSHLVNREFCLLNDESGLGKCVATAVYLGSIAKNKSCLIIVQNDDDLVTGWQFHFQVLTNLSVGVLGSNIGVLDPLPNIVIAKWATLRSTVDGSKYNFDYIIVDNRGQMMSNNFCMSMLLSNYEHKINLLISSVDVTADLKLLHNSLRLGGLLEHQFEQFKLFESKYKLPDLKDVLNKTADLEQYFRKREMISDYCKDFRLRRYRHQFDVELPLVDVERYKISLELWHTISSSNSSQKSDDHANNLNGNSETATEELFNQALALDREISGITGARQNQDGDLENNEPSEDAITMSPLLIDSESCSSGAADEEIEQVTNETKRNKKNQEEPDVYEFVDLSHDQGSEEYVSTGNLERRHNAYKSNECHSHPRSLTKKIHNQKTTEIEDIQQQHIQKIENEKDLTESKLNRKKTKLQVCKDTLGKKTIEEKRNSKTVSASKRRVQNKSEKKQNNISKKQMPVDLQDEGDNVKLLRHRGIKRIGNNSKEASKKQKETDEEKQSTTVCHTLNQTKGKCKDKRKLDSKNADPPKEQSVSGTKRDILKAANGNRDSEKERNVTKSQQDISETSIRRLRKFRGDAIVSPVCEASTIPKKTLRKNGGDKSPKSEKRRHKVSPRKKSHIEIPHTPTVRNTRRMQRLTRSSDSSKSKYMMSPLSLDSSRKPKKRKGGVTDNCSWAGIKDNHKVVGKSVDEGKISSSKKNKRSTVDIEKEIGGKTRKDSKTMYIRKQKLKSALEEPANLTDLVLLPCSETTDDMQCGQKVITDTPSDNGFLRPQTPIRVLRNSEPKNFLPTPIGFTDSEVVFVPPLDAHYKNQQVVVLFSSTDEGSVSSQQSAQSRRTRALKQKKSSKRATMDRERLAELSTPTFGELLAKQQMHRNSPDIFSASTDLGLTCTQQPAGGGNDGLDTFQGFKIFGSEVKQMQQQNALNSSGKQNKSKQVLSRGRSCLNILEKMFDSHTSDGTDNNQRKQSKKPEQSSKQAPDGKLVQRSTRGSHQVVPSLPNTVSTTQLPQSENQKDKPKQKQSNSSTNQIISGPMVDEEIFEITNNDAFGSVMRINSNGEISPVQAASRSLQTTQHNKITNYLIGSTQLTPTEATLEERTPSKRTQMQLSGTIARRSPKNRSTQSTKLTKWFQTNGVTLNDTQSNAEQNEIHVVRKHTRSAIAKRLKRRCLELSFSN